MSEHTPLPWYATRDDVYHRADGRQDWICHMNDADFRFDVLSDQESEEQQAANAEFIVRAANSHEELLAAAKTVVDWYGHHSGGPMIEALRGAIAKAERGES